MVLRVTVLLPNNGRNSVAKTACVGLQKLLGNPGKERLVYAKYLTMFRFVYIPNLPVSE